MSDVTRILDRVERGDPQAAEELLPLVYSELRRLAALKMAQEAPGQTLQPTALVHEAWLRLGGDAQPAWRNRGHFFGAAHTMARYETAFYRPLLSDWSNHGAWLEAGAHDALERATALWQRALADYQEPPMDQAIREELDAYVARRREEIGGGDP